MIKEIRTEKAFTDEMTNELVILMLHHAKVPDEAYVKIKSVHNDIVGHGGVKTTMSKL